MSTPVMKEEKKYQVVDGTFYDAQTPKAVIDILESSRKNRSRIAIIYGNVETGEEWPGSTLDRGFIGRSTGSIKIPLLIRTSRSLGGGAVLDNCIVKITESKGGRVLYKLGKKNE